MFRSLIFRTLTLSVVLMLTSFLFGSDKLVFDFESGDLQKEGWSIVCGANTKPIGCRDTEFHNNKIPYKKRGKYYLTTLESAQDSAPTDNNKCILQSPIFQITGDRISFLIGGGAQDQTGVALLELKEDNSFQEIFRAHGKNNQEMDPIDWNVTRYQGRYFVIQVIDNVFGGWGHIKCDAFDIDGKIDLVRTSAYQKYLSETQLAEQKKIAAKRTELKKNLDAPILYVSRQQYKRDHHNTATIFQKGEINQNSFVGRSFLRVWDPRTDKVKTLLELPDGIVRDPTVSHDGKHVLFSFRKSAQDDYHIGEMTIDLNRPAVVIKGSDTDQTNPFLTKGRKADGDFVFRQITFLSGVSDIDPIYLPTGEIMFASTREPKYCMCNRHIMCNLHKMNSDGSNILQVGKSTLFEGHLSLLSDGRILYDRWEYVDRNFGDAQGIWVVNPDGARHEIFWGNNTASPGGVIDAQILPESDSLFLCTFSSCHDRPWGAIALVDRRLGIDGRKSVLRTWPEDAIELIDNSPSRRGLLNEAGRYDAYSRLPLKFEDPYPWDNDLFLCAGTYGNGEVTAIYALEREGGMALVHSDPDGCFDPMPIRPSEKQTAIQNRVDLSKKTGTFFVFNVNEGDAMKPGFISDTSTGKKEGSVPVNIEKYQKEPVPKAKYLRVVESPEKRFWVGSYWNGGNGTQAPGMAWNDFNNKRILGTVEIEKDGSVFFEVPADRFVYFQLLDENRQLIQSMRSGVMVRPGEANSCVGCHENRLEAPSSAYTISKTNKGTPKKPAPWFGPERLFSYCAEVQPVFDKYCVCCHDFGKKGARSVNLAGDLNMIFNTSYVELRSKNLVSVPGAGPHLVLPPRSWGSSQSRLAKVVSGHHPKPEIDQKRKELGVWFDAKTNPEAYQRVITWIDINAPYYPVYGSAYTQNRFGRAPLDNNQIKRLEDLTGVKTIPIREGADNSGAMSGIDFTVSFTRPEMSPCLSKWSTEKEKNSPEYKEALALLNIGKSNLEKQNRGESPDFQPTVEKEILQQKKYDSLREREQKMRNAVLNGNKFFDYNE